MLEKRGSWGCYIDSVSPDSVKARAAPLLGSVGG